MQVPDIGKTLNNMIIKLTKDQYSNLIILLQRVPLAGYEVSKYLDIAKTLNKQSIKYIFKEDK